MKVVGLYLVRNEVDLVEVNLLHHFATAIDEAIVIDNGSTDGTLEKLTALADSMPIQLASEPGPYDQSNRVTRMARLAVQNGADWLLPIDADEFWVGIGTTLRSILECLPSDVSGVRAEIVNFVQRRNVLSASPHALLSMTMRPEDQVGPIEDCEELVEAEQIGFVEMMYPPKWVSRASPDIVVQNGNHSVEGLPDGTTMTGRVLCLHAPLRARSLLTGKLDQGRRVIEDEGRQDYWHVRRWWRLCREGAIEAEWAANSYENGSISVGGQERRLVEDHRLRDAVSPHISRTDPEGLDEREAANPAVAAYSLALDTVPGALEDLDYMLVCELDRIQRSNAVDGDLLEIGTGSAKSAILLGYLADLSHDLLSVCGSVGQREADSSEILAALQNRESTSLPPDFIDQYLRFHTRLPPVLAPRPEQIDIGALKDSFRIVYIGGGPDYHSARQEIRVAQALAGPGGVVVFGDMFRRENPGLALAVWEEVLSGNFVPLCLTDAMLCGTWDPRGIDWHNAIHGWAGRNPEVEGEVHSLAGWPVRRLVAVPRPTVASQGMRQIPSLEELDGADELKTPTVEDPERSREPEGVVDPEIVEDHENVEDPEPSATAAMIRRLAHRLAHR
jgi:hypothetical protein